MPSCGERDGGTCHNDGPGHGVMKGRADTVEVIAGEEVHVIG